MIFRRFPSPRCYLQTDTFPSDNVTRGDSIGKWRSAAGDLVESKIGREGWKRRLVGRKERGPETASLNNILRQCKERLLGHYRRWLTILAIWLGQCYVSGLDSLSSTPPTISPFLPRRF